MVIDGWMGVNGWVVMDDAWMMERVSWGGAVFILARPYLRCLIAQLHVGLVFPPVSASGDKARKRRSPPLDDPG